MIPSSAMLLPAVGRAASVAALAAGGGLLAAGAALAAGPVAALGLGVLALAGVALLRLPARWWPSLLLLVTIAAPADALPLPGFRGNNGSVNQALLLVPLWLLVELRAGRPLLLREPSRGRATATALVLVTVLALETATSPDLLTSLGWAVNFVVMTVVVALAVPRGAAALAVRTWVASGGVLGAYAVAEVYVLHANPLWGWSGSSSGGRAFASMGFPLHAATFFAGATVLGTHRLLLKASPLAVAVVAGCAGGLAATGSRGALIAAGVGILTIAVGAAATRSRAATQGRRQVLVFTAVVLAFGVVAGAGLAQRTAAGGEEGSNVVRARSLATGIVIARGAGLLGDGPGRAYSVKVETPGPGTDEERSVENAWLEFYIGVGALGCISTTGLVLVCLGAGARARAWDAVAVSLTLLVAFGFYNALEGAKPLNMLLLGLGFAGCLVTRDSPRGARGGERAADRPALSPTRRDVVGRAHSS